MAQPNLVEATRAARTQGAAAARPPDAERRRWLRFWLSNGAALRSSPPHLAARRELRRLALRLPACLALALPSLLLAANWSPALSVYRWASARAPHVGLLLLALSTWIVLWGALPVHERALRSLRERRADDALLASLATVNALVLGFLPLLGGREQLLFADLALAPTVTLFALLLALSERLVRRAAHSALHAIARLSPPSARRLDERDEEQLVAIEALRVGDRIRVQPRELIALDGVILEGRSSVKEQRVTGEPLPVDKRKGASVIGGTRNGRGVLVVRVTRTKADGVLAVIARAARQAAQTEALLETRAERAGGALVVLVLTLSGLALSSSLLSSPGDLRGALLTCLTLFVIAVPGALPLAVFLAFRIGLGRAVRAGLMVPSADALAALSRIDTVVVGKTGTLTEGRARVISVVPAEDCSEDQLLAMAAGLVRGHSLPFATAVLTRAETLATEIAPVEDVTELPGCGYLGRLGAARVGLGNRTLLTLLGARDVTLEGKAEALCDHGQTVAFVIWDGRLRGLIGCVDPVKLTTRDALRELEDLGVRTVLCTADAQRTALHLTAQLGIHELYAQTPPAEKVQVVRRLADRGASLAFASRSPHERPALERAQLAVGLCLAAQLDERWPSATQPPEGPLAGGSVRVDLVRGDLAALARAVALSRAVLRSGRRSLWLGLGYHALALPLAAGIFGPAWHISVAASSPIAQLVALLGLFLLVGHALLLRRTAL